MPSRKGRLRAKHTKKHACTTDKGVFEEFLKNFLPFGGVFCVFCVPLLSSVVHARFSLHAKHAEKGGYPKRMHANATDFGENNGFFDSSVVHACFFPFANAL